ncbi:MAG: protein kinase [Pirellulaceae bacterium]
MQNERLMLAAVNPCADEFLQAYQNGQQPDIDEFLGRVDAEYRHVLLEDLIRIEHRFMDGARFFERREWYSARFPEYSHVIDVVWRELSASGTIIPDASKLLAVGADAEAGGLPTEGVDVGGPISSSDSSADDETLAATPLAPGRLRAAAPLNIGRYRLLQQIGRGGMGSVWLAEQQSPVYRRVAIKLIREEFETKEVLARFAAERQALALMDHPNIARILDGGQTDDNRPYFVMELVRGIPFSEYCEKHRLSLHERLRLFVPLCQAIHHAHQKSIIHRDLKPSNVLVAESDGKPVPKIIDFGLAKAMESTLTDMTCVTQFGQVMGTLRYMSPEQADVDTQDIDTRSDIYSLGVMLYELLTGTTPIDDTYAKTPRNKLLSIIREFDPPRPSNRLSSIHSKDIIAATRGIEANRLNLMLRGDLDWIVMKAIEKDRARRYDSAVALADDITRFLSNEPVLARPPSTSYRMKKWIRRHRIVFATGSVMATSLLAGLGALVYSHQRVSAARDALVQKNGELDQVNAKVLAVGEQLTQSQRARDVAVGQRDEAVAKTEQARRETKAAVEQLQQTTLEKERVEELQVVEKQKLESVQKAKAMAEAERDKALLAEMEAMRAKQAALKNRDEAEASAQAAMANAETAKAEADRQYQRAEVVLALMTHGILGRNGEDAADPNTPLSQVLDRTSEQISAIDFEPSFEADIRHTLGYSYLELGLFEQARPHAEKAYQLRQRLLQEKPAAQRAAMYESLFNLARLDEESGDLENAESRFKEVLQWRQKHQPENVASILRSQYALANVLLLQLEVDEAETQLRSIVRTYNANKDNEAAIPVLLQSMRRLGILILNKNEPEEAVQGVKLIEEAIAIGRDKFGTEPDETTLKLLATFYYKNGDEENFDRIRKQLEEKP